MRDKVRAPLALLVFLCLFLGEWPGSFRLGNGLFDFFLAHPYFSLEEVRVEGGRRVGGEDILAFAGLHQGVSIWSLDPRAIEERVTRHPWVRRVRVRREFPRRIAVRVEEWRARGIVSLTGLHYVSPDGWVFKEVSAGERLDLPFITGLKQESALSLAGPDRQKITEALTLIELLGAGSVSEVRFDHFGGVVVYPLAFPVPIRMGWGDWQRKIDRLQRVLPQWKGREQYLAALDLSFRDQVVAQLKEGI